MTFREGNANSPLCKEIQIINDDDDDEGLEEFTVQLVLVAAVGVQVAFDPLFTFVKIIDSRQMDEEDGNHYI